MIVKPSIAKLIQHELTAKNLFPKQTWDGLWPRHEVVLLSFLKR